MSAQRIFSSKKIGVARNGFKNRERATSAGWRKGKYGKRGKKGIIGVNKGERSRGVKRRNKKKS